MSGRATQGPVRLFDHWPAARAGLEGKEILLFLDYDGTLAPIMPRPEQAVMPVETRNLLNALLKTGRCRIILISGRKLSDLKTASGLEGPTYIGSHGFEAEGRGAWDTESLIPSGYKNDLAAIREGLKKQLPSLPGVWVEDKGVILTTHFRQTAQEIETAAKDAISGLCRDLEAAGRISVMEGKKVVEIRPAVRWNKGEAVMRLLSENGKPAGGRAAAAVYIGDDTTDEDAFVLLRGQGTTVKVGADAASAAEYYIDSQNDVHAVLDEILKTAQRTPGET